MPLAVHSYGSAPRIIGEDNLDSDGYGNYASEALFSKPELILSKAPLIKRVVGELPRNAGPVEYMQFGNIPMQDWDFPDAIHPNAAVTVRHLGDAYASLVKRTTDNANERWRMYLTPGGIRAWNLTDQVTPTQQNTAREYRDSMNSDPLYAMFSERENVWSSRISAKNRPDDFVAYPIAEVGNGLPNPQNLNLVQRYHDIPIIENRAASQLPAYGLPQSGVELLERQMQTLPRKVQPAIEKVLSRLSKGRIIGR